MALRAPKRRSSAPERRHRSGRPPAASLAESHGQERATAEKIATRLGEDIVLGRRHPRERLVEQDLCDRFNTHRADVRLALFELEKKGIVQRIPNRGAIVRDLTPREVMDIYAVREELEVMAARILPFPVDETELAKLDQLQRQPICIFTRLCSVCARRSTRHDEIISKWSWLCAPRAATI